VSCAERLRLAQAQLQQARPKTEDSGKTDLLARFKRKSFTANQ